MFCVLCDSRALRVIAGNVATAGGTKALIEAVLLMRLRLVSDPVPFCTTRVVAGIGVPSDQRRNGCLFRSKRI